MYVRQRPLVAAGVITAAKEEEVWRADSLYMEVRDGRSGQNRTKPEVNRKLFSHIMWLILIMYVINWSYRSEFDPKNLNEEFYRLSRTKRTMKVQFPAVITVIVTGNRP